MFKIKFSLKYFLLWLVIILGINYKTFYKASEDESSSSGTTTEIVATWSIKNVIEVVWEAELVDEQSLQFTKEWTITKVNFKAGDSIKKWDIIAELDSSDAYDSIDEALISLDNAKISYEQLFDEADKSQILQAQNSITTAENNYTIAKKELDNLKNTQANSIVNLEKNIETAKKELESAVSSLELTKKELETTKKEQSNSLNNTVSNKSTTVQNIEDSFKTNIAEIEKIIEHSDYIMGVTTENETKNDKYENFLWAKNAAVKSAAINGLLESISLHNKLKTNLEKYNYNWDTESIKSLLKEFIAVYVKLGEATDNIYKTLDNSIESSWVLTSSDIDSKKSTMSSDRTTSLNKIASLNTSINTLNTLTNTDLVSETNSNSIANKEESMKTSELNIEKKKLDIENSEKTLETTKESNKITLESKEKDLDSKERSVEVAILNLEELLDWPTEENIQKSKNSIKQAELKLESAYKNLDDYLLEAPFNWVVRKIDYMVWDNLTNDTDKYVYIENPDLLEITVMLDQIDITKVKLKQDANVIFDAYATTTVKAKVSSIDTEPIETSGVVSYKVKLILDDDTFDKKILSWMWANIEIIVESKDNIVVVKTTAITEKDSKKYVTVKKNWQEKQTEIVTWIAADWLTEVASWLNVWDEVVIKEYVSTSTEEESTTSLFSPPWRSSSSSSSKSSSSSSSRSSNMQWPPGF